MNDLESTLRSRLHDLADAAPDGDGLDNAVTARGRHQRQRRTRLAVLAVCAGLVVVAGGSTAAGALLSSGPDGGVAVPGEVTPATPTPGPAPTSRPAPSPGPSPSAPSSSTPAPPPSSSAPSSSAPSSAPAPGTPVSPAGSPGSGAPASPPRSTPATEEPAAWPAEATAVHGGSYWAVFLDVSRAGDTAGEQEAREALAAAPLPEV